MPVSCDVSIANLSTEEFRELDYLVMRHAFDSQNEIGRLADERIYQADLAERLQAVGMFVNRELEVRLSHRDFCKSLYLDLVVAEQAVYELKVVNEIKDFHLGQLLSYLLILDLAHGKLLNFRSESVESQFVNATMTTDERRMFAVNETEYKGEERFRDIVVGLIRDWGTCLTLSLYQEAVVGLLGGAEGVEAMLPMKRNGVSLGNQRFYLADHKTAFTLTAMNQKTSAYQSQLSRLVLLSPLRAIHWVNLTCHEVTLTTIARGR